MPQLGRAAEGARLIKAYVVAFVIMSILGMIIANLLQTEPPPQVSEIMWGNTTTADSPTLRNTIARWVTDSMIDYHAKVFVFSGIVSAITGFILYSAFKAILSWHEKRRKILVLIAVSYFGATLTYLATSVYATLTINEVYSIIHEAAASAQDPSDALIAAVSTAYGLPQILAFFASAGLFEFMKSTSVASAYIVLGREGVKFSNVIAALFVAEGVYNIIRYGLLITASPYAILMGPVSGIMIMVTAVRLLMQWGNANLIAKTML